MTAPPPACLPEAARVYAGAFRRRVAEVMGTPLVGVAPGSTLEEAARRMRAAGVSALVLVEDGAARGILTERDVVEALSRHGAAAAALAADAVAMRPMHTVAADAFVYVAEGRMARLGVRHLVVVDAAGRPVGMVSARGLLKERAGGALAMGDAVAGAGDAAALAAARAGLPSLARALLAEGLDGREVAAVTAAVLRESTARAAELAAAALGPPPAPWCVLVLGSGGRGESLLAADQDNAIVHGGTAAHDAWFAEAGRRIADTLDAAGVPFCRGGIMAANAAWRHPLDGWLALVAGWARRAEGESLLAADIFYDFAPVHGDAALADRLRTGALAIARDPMFLKMLAHDLAGFRAPVGWFGRLRTEGGLLDLKMHGLHPVVGAARILALRLGLEATGTAERLLRGEAAGAIPESDRAPVDAAHALFTRLVLESQIDALAAGNAPGNRIAPARLTPYRRRALADALHTAAAFAASIHDAVAFAPRPAPHTARGAAAR